MSYAMPPQQPTKRGTPWVLVTGLVILLISFVLCGIGGFAVLGQSQDLADEPMQTGAFTVTLEEGESVAVWSETESASCTVTGPAGAVTDSGSGDQTVTAGGKTLHRVMAIDADQAGSHTITCTAPFVVGDNLSVGSIVLASIGGALCCIAVVVTVVGLVLWLRRRRA
ncbi:hypothetical protein ACQBJO_00480 [Janibacter sp. G349]|uniref:hypothetical protein n=1 Tax=unclassified Janibacter TaxID=2649294 RepID=UPI0020CF0C9B|nr:hypothetical protein [Janibacter sp. CX7]UTT66215.1 hypothetical protein NMQ01_00405 [Janibacter sp. CX7]